MSNPIFSLLFRIWVTSPLSSQQSYSKVEQLGMYSNQRKSLFPFVPKKEIPHRYDRSMSFLLRNDDQPHKGCHSRIKKQTLPILSKEEMDGFQDSLA